MYGRYKQCFTHRVKGWGMGSFGGGNVLLVSENLRSDFDYFIHFKAKNNIMGMLNINQNSNKHNLCVQRV